MTKGRAGLKRLFMYSSSGSLRMLAPQKPSVLYYIEHLNNIKSKQYKNNKIAFVGEANEWCIIGRTLEAPLSNCLHPARTQTPGAQ